MARKVKYLSLAILLGATVAWAAVDPESATTVGSQAAQANTVNWNTVILAFFSLLTTAVTTFGGIYLYKIKAISEMTHTSSEITRAAAVSTATNIGEIHTAVNSERTAREKLIDDLKSERVPMMKAIEDLRAEVLALSRQNAVLVDQSQKP